jgi:Fur family ferric uptake transcriptional regulator
METPDTTTALGALVSEQGYRMTTPRRHVLDVLPASGAPLSVADIHERIRSRIRSRRVSLASVYRTVNLLLRLGVVRATDAVGGPQRFEIGGPFGGHHHHLICQQCGRIEDLDGCPLGDAAWQAMNRRVRRTRKFRVVDHDLRLLGACHECTKGRRARTTRR